MFILFGSKSQKTHTSSGVIVERYCIQCDCVRECEEYFENSKNSYTVFFVPITSSENTTPKYKCITCGGTWCFDLPDPRIGRSGIEDLDLNLGEGSEKVKPLNNPEALKKIVIACRFCQKKIRIPCLSKAIVVTCPHCKNKFKITQNPFDELDVLIDLDTKLESILMGDIIKKKRLISYYINKFPNLTKVQIYRSIIDDIRRDNY